MQDYNNANNLWYSLLSRWFSFKLTYSTLISGTVPQEKSAVKCFAQGHSGGLSVTLHFTGSPALLRALATRLIPHHTAPFQDDRKSVV